MSDLVGFNPDDPLQQSFLQALAQGETGGAANAAQMGVGGANLSGSSTDEYGFPLWTGLGNSHAAGTYQFQPGTWDAIASQFGLSFSNSSDQSAGAWYLAEQTYQQKTGGSLEDALSSGKFSSVQAALASIWPSVTGNQAAPQGLAASLSSGATTSAATPSDTTAGGSTVDANGNTSRVNGFLNGTLGAVGSIVGDQFSRVGLIVLGVVIIGAALWALLAQQGIAPTPRQLVKSV